MESNNISTNLESNNRFKIKIFGPSTDTGIQPQISSLSLVYFSNQQQIIVPNNRYLVLKKRLILIKQQIMESNNRTLSLESNNRFKDPTIDTKFVIQQ